MRRLTTIGLVLTSIYAIGALPEPAEAGTFWRVTVCHTVRDHPIINVRYNADGSPYWWLWGYATHSDCSTYVI